MLTIKEAANQSIAADLSAIANMNIAELRDRWRLTFRSDPPKAFGPDLLRRSIAQRLQESELGGLSAETSKLLKQLVVQSKSNGKLVLPRRIQPGSILVRQWKGQSHRVTVTENGFSFEGKPFNNLSEIARLITGSRWNGPRFFGLRKPGADS